MKLRALFVLFFLANSLIITPEEKRIDDYKKEITDSVSFPEKLRLFYKGKKDDFVVFYDLNGSEAYYKYRRNKFDHDAEKSVMDLTEGSPFEVEGEFNGMLVFRNNVPLPVYVDKAGLKTEEMQDKHSIPVFRLRGFIALAPEGIVF